MSISPLHYAKWIEWIIKFIFFIFCIYLQPLVAYELMKYQRGCDTWQATAKMVQPCLFIHEISKCTVNCAISSWNFSNHYIISDHYSDVILGVLTSQITSLTIVYSTVYSGADQRKHQSSASPAFKREIHRWPVNSPYKWPVTWKIFSFDDVIMTYSGAVVLTERS